MMWTPYSLIVAVLARRGLGDIEPTFTWAFTRLGITIVALGGLILLQPRLAAPRRPLWEGAALVVLALDLIATGWGLNPTIEPDYYRERSPLANVATATRTLYLPQDEYEAKFNTFLDFKAFGPSTRAAWKPLRESLLPNLGMLDGVPSANNFDPLRVGPHDALFESTRDLPLEQALPRLRAMNVGILLTTGELAGLEQRAQAGPVTAYTVPDPQPRAYVVGEAWQAANVDEALAAMSRSDFDPARVVILEGSPGRLSRITSPDHTLSIIEDGPQVVTLDVQTDNEGWLILTDSWYPGWQATLDGKPVPILRANAAFRAITLTAGQHSVSFTYRPFSFRAGAAISLASLGGLAAILLFGRARQRS